MENQIVKIIFFSVKQKQMVSILEKFILCLEILHRGAIAEKKGKISEERPDI